MVWRTCQKVRFLTLWLIDSKLVPAELQTVKNLSKPQEQFDRGTLFVFSGVTSDETNYDNV